MPLAQMIELADTILLTSVRNDLAQSLDRVHCMCSKLARSFARIGTQLVHTATHEPGAYRDSQQKRDQRQSQQRIVGRKHEQYGSRHQ